MQQYSPYIITSIIPDADSTVIIKVRPQTGGNIFPFTSGQWVYLKNPKSITPHEPHPFTIASSPYTSDLLEFCIKALGDWTREVTQLTPGDLLEISEPQGTFTWSDDIASAVFLVGGVGITPYISILRTLRDKNQQIPITMLYGSRTEETIVYKDELVKLQKALPLFRVIYILSHLSEKDSWTGPRGFITQNILEKEVPYIHKPIFFVSGPPIFVEKMNALLAVMAVSSDNVRQELLTEKKSI